MRHKESHTLQTILFRVLLFLVISISLSLVYAFIPGDAGSKSEKTGSLTYLNPKLPVEKRVDDLLKRMTLVEKVGQMCQFAGISPESAGLAREGRVGSFLDVTSLEEIDSLQRVAVTGSRLGIPLLFGLDVIHGYSTIFPIPLAQASTWDPDLVKTCASVAAREAYSRGIRWTFSPMVDIARDPRWGRIAEGAGEDPFLGSEMARALVEGYQGAELSPDSRLVACVKHYVAYGAAEGGRDYNTAEVSERTLSEIYLPPFKAAVDAGAGTVMSAFDDLDGVPASANRHTLRDILKGEWGFKGFVVSDWDAIGELINHGIACDSAEAAEKAAIAGVDMDMVGPYHDNLVKLVESGKVPVKVIDDAVRRILRVKFELGLFEHPYVRSSASSSDLMLPEYRQTAMEEARQSIVLLKNEGEVLPLSKTIKSIAVIGPLADSKRDMLGCWYCKGRPDSVVTLLSGIKAKLPDASVLYERGCSITDTSTAGFADALDAARHADAVILAVGESGDMTGEARSRSSLNLPGVQNKLVKQIVSLGKPTIEVLMNGRPLSIRWDAAHVPAILETWFLGTEAGSAIADVLFGDYNPSGKLPVSFPRTVGQVPIYYDHMNTGRPASDSDNYTSKYIDLPSTPLFPFGFGLSYTKFEYSDLHVSPVDDVKDKLIVSFDVSNVGNRRGTEVAQVYINQRCTSVTRPVKQLKGFVRLDLAPGQTKRAEVALTSYDISFIDNRLQRVVEPGDITIMVGGNSADVISTTAHVDSGMIIR